jgi:hypothetical protein
MGTIVPRFEWQLGAAVAGALLLLGVRRLARPLAPASLSGDLAERA